MDDSKPTDRVVVLETQPNSNVSRRWFSRLGVAVPAIIGGAWLRKRALGETATQGYPQPTYLPSGYRLLREYKHPPDGFGDDDSQLAYSYTNRSTVPLYPIRIVITKRPTQPFFGTGAHDAALSLQLSAGIQAKY